MRSQILIKEYIGSELLTLSSCDDIDDAISDNVFSTCDAETLCACNEIESWKPVVRQN